MYDNLGRHREKTKEYFDTAADKYKGIYDPVSSFAFKVQTWIKSRTFELATGSTSLLDCGCGNGDFIFKYAEKTPFYRKIVGVDFSIKMIEAAQRNSENLNSIYFKTGDIKTLNFLKMEFETVICLGVLHHIHPKEFDEVLVNMARVSSKYLILEYKNNFSPYHILKKIKARSGNMMLQISGTNLLKLNKILKKEGFIVEKKVSWLSFGYILSPIVIVRFERISF